MKFKRIDNYVVDIDKMYLVNTDRGIIHNFDFDNMIVRKISQQGKVASPIRYDEETDKMLIWKQRRWQPIESGQKAILYMFNARIESSLLED